MITIRTVIFGILVTCISTQVCGQVTVNTIMPLEQVVQDLEGEGVIISNISIDVPLGSSPSAAAFTHQSGNFLGIRDGLLMTTGAAVNVLGPNDQGDISRDNQVSGVNDSDLRTLEPSLPLFDIATIEFDITVASTEIKFNYVFGSDEYIEWVNESYNDVFGFFLSGPGITDPINLAVVNGAPVSVDNINHLTNTQFYRGNGNGNTPQFFTELQYDGFTRVLEARAEVAPCETYHIKLVIADVGDGIYDSGVFIEQGSITSETPPLIELAYEDPEYPFAVENCNYGEFQIFRTGASDLNTSFTYNYELTGSAEAGVDFPFQSGELIIAPGADYGSVVIDPIYDSLLEGEETVILTLVGECELVDDIAVAEMPVRDFLPYALDDDTLCFGESVVLNEEYNEPYDVVWGPDTYLNATNVNSPTATPLADHYFDFTIDYKNGCIAGDSIFVEVVDPRAFFEVGQLDEYTSLDVAPDNLSINAQTYLWDFGDGTTSNFFETEHTYELTDPSDSQEYTITLTAFTHDPACQHTYDTTIVISPFFIPNIITPNEDRTNDDFVVDGIVPGVWEFDVYNRWGKRVYSTDSYDNDWEADGQEDGLYYFLLKNPPGDRSYKGWVQVMR